MWFFKKKKSLAEQKTDLERQIKIESQKASSNVNERRLENQVSQRKETLSKLKSLNQRHTPVGNLMGVVRKSPEYAGKAVGGIVKVAGGVGKVANEVGIAVGEAFPEQKKVKTVKKRKKSKNQPVKQKSFGPNIQIPRFNI
jgi:hypothetical protein